MCHARFSRGENSGSGAPHQAGHKPDETDGAGQNEPKDSEEVVMGDTPPILDRCIDVASMSVSAPMNHRRQISCGQGSDRDAVRCRLVRLVAMDMVTCAIL